MGTVTIGADTFDIYGTTAGLTTYANGSLAFYATWSAATSDNRSRALVEATKMLDRQSWQGEKTVDGQALAWPRTGVVDADGEEVDDATVPSSIVDATYELTLAGLADLSVFQSTTTAKNVASISTSETSVSFFGPRAGGRFPPRVMELIAWAFAGAESTNAAASIAYGTDGESQFDDDEDNDDDDSLSVSGP